MGEVPERPNGAGCKPVGVAYVGSNPSLPTSFVYSISYIVYREERGYVVSDKSVRHWCLLNKKFSLPSGERMEGEGSRHTIYEIRYTGLKLPM